MAKTLRTATYEDVAPRRTQGRTRRSANAESPLDVNQIDGEFASGPSEGHIDPASVFPVSQLNLPRGLEPGLTDFRSRAEALKYFLRSKPLGDPDVVDLVQRTLRISASTRASIESAIEQETRFLVGSDGQSRAETAFDPNADALRGEQVPTVLRYSLMNADDPSVTDAANERQMQGLLLIADTVDGRRHILNHSFSSNDPAQVQSDPVFSSIVRSRSSLPAGFSDIGELSSEDHEALLASELSPQQLSAFRERRLIDTESSFGSGRPIAVFSVYPSDHPEFATITSGRRDMTVAETGEERRGEFGRLIVVGTEASGARHILRHNFGNQTRAEIEQFLDKQVRTVGRINARHWEPAGQGPAPARIRSQTSNSPVSTDTDPGDSAAQTENARALSSDITSWAFVGGSVDEAAVAGHWTDAVLSWGDPEIRAATIRQNRRHGLGDGEAGELAEAERSAGHRAAFAQAQDTIDFRSYAVRALEDATPKRLPVTVTLESVQSARRNDWLERPDLRAHTLELMIDKVLAVPTVSADLALPDGQVRDVKEHVRSSEAARGRIEEDSPNGAFSTAFDVFAEDHRIRMEARDAASIGIVVASKRPNDIAQRLDGSGLRDLAATASPAFAALHEKQVRRPHLWQEERARSPRVQFSLIAAGDSVTRAFGLPSDAATSATGERSWSRDGFRFAIEDGSSDSSRIAQARAGVRAVDHCALFMDQAIDPKSVEIRAAALALRMGKAETAEIEGRRVAPRTALARLHPVVLTESELALQETLKKANIPLRSAAGHEWLSRVLRNRQSEIRLSESQETIASFVAMAVGDGDITGLSRSFGVPADALRRIRDMPAIDLDRSIQWARVVHNEPDLVPRSELLGTAFFGQKADVLPASMTVLGGRAALDAVSNTRDAVNFTGDHTGLMSQGAQASDDMLEAVRNGQDIVVQAGTVAELVLDNVLDQLPATGGRVTLMLPGSNTMWPDLPDPVIWQQRPASSDNAPTLATGQIADLDHSVSIERVDGADIFIQAGEAKPVVLRSDLTGDAEQDRVRLSRAVAAALPPGTLLGPDNLLELERAESFTDQHTGRMTDRLMVEGHTVSIRHRAIAVSASVRDGEGMRVGEPLRVSTEPCYPNDSKVPEPADPSDRKAIHAAQIVTAHDGRDLDRAVQRAQRGIESRTNQILSQSFRHDLIERLLHRNQEQPQAAVIKAGPVTVGYEVPVQATHTRAGGRVGDSDKEEATVNVTHFKNPLVPVDSLVSGALLCGDLDTTARRRADQELMAHTNVRANYLVSASTVSRGELEPTRAPVLSSVIEQTCDGLPLIVAAPKGREKYLDPSATFLVTPPADKPVRGAIRGPADLGLVSEAKTRFHEMLARAFDDQRGLAINATAGRAMEGVPAQAQWLSEAAVRPEPGAVVGAGPAELAPIGPAPAKSPTPLAETARGAVTQDAPDPMRSALRDALQRETSSPGRSGSSKQRTDAAVR